MHRVYIKYALYIGGESGGKGKSALYIQYEHVGIYVYCIMDMHGFIYSLTFYSST